VRGKPYGAASDAWAVGCILFNLLTLHPPFRHASILGLARQIVAVEFIAVARRALDACAHPPDIKKLASRDGLLNPNPDRRTTLKHVLEMYPLNQDE
jgi:serine/threonine protein kinase